MDIYSHNKNRDQSEDQTVSQSDFTFLENKSDLVCCGKVLISYNPYGDSQGLGTHITGHGKDQRLESDDNGDRCYDSLKCSHKRGGKHSEKQQGNKPGNTLFNGR